MNYYLLLFNDKYPYHRTPLFRYVQLFLVNIFFLHKTKLKQKSSLYITIYLPLNCIVLNQSVVEIEKSISITVAI